MNGESFQNRMDVFNQVEKIHQDQVRKYHSKIQGRRWGKGMAILRKIHMEIETEKQKRIELWEGL